MVEVTLAAAQRATGPSLGSICASALVVAVARTIGKSALLAKRASPDSHPSAGRGSLTLSAHDPGDEPPGQRPSRPADVPLGAHPLVWLLRWRARARKRVRARLRRDHGRGVLAIGAARRRTRGTKTPGPPVRLYVPRVSSCALPTDETSERVKTPSSSSS